MNNVELYWNDDRTCYAVLVSYGFGAGWSSWGEPELAYDKRVVEFWLSHKDDREWMSTVDRFGLMSSHASAAYEEASKFFDSIGYSNYCLGGFSDIKLKWVPRGSKWRINEYDGAESIEYETKVNWNCF